jgi:hypothetical protein
LWKPVGRLQPLIETDVADLYDKNKLFYRMLILALGRCACGIRSAWEKKDLTLPKVTITNEWWESSDYEDVEKQAELDEEERSYVDRNKDKMFPPSAAELKNRQRAEQKVRLKFETVIRVRKENVLNFSYP